MTWLFRVASRPEVGAGHISRCRSLARVLHKSVPVIFMLDADGQHWRQSLEADGFGVMAEEQTVEGEWSGVVLDHYDFDADAAEVLAAKTGPMVYMDDFMKPPPCANLAINPAPDIAGDYIGDIPALLGPRFALLNARFANAARHDVKESVEKIVVTFGARDSNNATELALEALRRQPHPANISVVMGRHAPHLTGITDTVSNMGDGVALRIDEMDMPSLLQSADFVIGGGGVSLLERMACGLPSVTIALAENQRNACNSAAKLGGTLFAGWLGELEPDSLSGQISDMINDVTARRKMSKDAAELVDGGGADRVAHRMLQLSS